jgi:hypothetical protein
VPKEQTEAAHKLLDEYKNAKEEVEDE